jgi:hypothetical protein
VQPPQNTNDSFLIKKPLKIVQSINAIEKYGNGKKDQHHFDPGNIRKESIFYQEDVAGKSDKKDNENNIGNVIWITAPKSSINGQHKNYSYQ